MTDTGRIVEVSVAPLGDTLAADHAAGATVLTLGSVLDFNEDGGALSYVSPADDTTLVVLGYSSVDPDADTISLTNVLPAALPEDTFISVDPFGADKVALVALDDGDGSITARVPNALFDRIPEGVRTPSTQEAVEVDRDSGGEHYIVDLLGMGDTVTDGEKIKLPNGTSLQDIYDAANQAAADAADAALTATTALTAANGKNVVWVSTAGPGSTPNIAGDIWWQKEIGRAHV